MKASKQCPKCHSRKVGYLRDVIDMGNGGVGASVIGRQHCEGWFKGGGYVGKFEAYVCADCGYYEHYVKDPASVPFDKIDGFHWLNPDSSDAGPYR